MTGVFDLSDADRAAAVEHVKRATAEAALTGLPDATPLRPLDRVAVVYVRQSTPQQVADHKESTARQYALADRAVALGWTRDRVTLIDDDLGKSGQSIEGRLGFQRLLAEVAPIASGEPAFIPSNSAASRSSSCG